MVRCGTVVYVRDMAVRVRVSAVERERIGRAAELAGRSVSDWCRRVLLDRAAGEVLAEGDEETVGVLSAASPAPSPSASSSFKPDPKPGGRRGGAGLGGGDPDGGSAFPEVLSAALLGGAVDTVTAAVSSPPPNREALDGRGGMVAGEIPARVDSGAAPQSPRPVHRETPSRPSSVCGFDTPKGVKCKSCGRVH